MAAREPADATTRPAPVEDSKVNEALYKLLYLDELDSRGLAAELRRLAETAGETIYSELIYMLSHLRFEPTEARRHWTKIVAHADSLERRLAAPMDLRVALVSYFIHINRQFKNPKVMELRLYEQTRSYAYRDELTGLHNYRALCECLNREVLRVDRNNSPLSLIMLDIDSFKAYNDRHGHDEANDVLSLLGQLLQRTARKVDLVARYGGEEFSVVLPDTEKIKAAELAERFRATVERYPFPHRESQPQGRLTVSLGVATYPGDANGATSLIRCADRALYVAKDRGKNQVQLYGEDRRSYRRRDVRLATQVRSLSSKRRTASTVNLSERGALFVDEQNREPGSLVELTIELPAGGETITAVGRVATVKECGPDCFEVGVHFIDLDTDSRHALLGFLRENGSSLHEELTAEGAPDLVRN